MKIIFALLFIIYPIWSLPQTKELPRATPQSQGVSARQIQVMFDSLMSLPDTEIHSVVVARHGKIIGEIYPRPFTPESMHTLYSCSKTFVGAAIGIAIAENRLRLTDRIATLLPEYLPQEISANLASITIRDLLTMSSGITPDWDMRNRGEHWITKYLSKEVSTPGTKFQYDSICSYLLSAIIQKVTGQTTLDYVNEKIFIPLHITKADWELSPEGFNTGGWGLRLQSESMMKFGLLILNKGKWNGNQLIPASWIEEMTAKQIEVGDEDYGYQMWLCDEPGAIRADGAYGQYIIVYPPKDMVVVVTQCSLINGMIPRHIIYNHLFREESKTNPATFRGSEVILRQKEYALPIIKGKAKARTMQMINQHRYRLESNALGWASIQLTSKPSGLEVNIVDTDNVETCLLAQHNEWAENIIETYPPYSVEAIGRYKGIEGPFKAAASYAWVKGNLHIKIHYTDWISSLHIECKDITNGQMVLSVKCNYSSDPVTIHGVI